MKKLWHTEPLLSPYFLRLLQQDLDRRLPFRTLQAACYFVCSKYVVLPPNFGAVELIETTLDILRLRYICELGFVFVWNQADYLGWISPK
jgi:hypothetical protein